MSEVKHVVFGTSLFRGKVSFVTDESDADAAYRAFVDAYNASFPNDQIRLSSHKALTYAVTIKTADRYVHEVSEQGDLPVTGWLLHFSKCEEHGPLRVERID